MSSHLGINPLSKSKAILFKNGKMVYNFANFRDTPLQPIVFSRPPIQGHIKTPYTKNGHFRDPLFKKFLTHPPTPIQNWLKGYWNV